MCLNSFRHPASYLLLDSSYGPLPDAPGDRWGLHIYFVEGATDLVDALAQLRLRRSRRLKFGNPVNERSIPTAHTTMRLNPLPVLEIGLQTDQRGGQQARESHGHADFRVDRVLQRGEDAAADDRSKDGGRPA